MTKSTKAKLFTIINLFLAFSTIIVTITTITQGTVAGQVDTGQNYGLFYLATFTMDSNIFLGIVALVAACYTLLHLSHHVSPSQTVTTTQTTIHHAKTTTAPTAQAKTTHHAKEALSIWYLVATTAALLTFLVVVLFLAPLRAFQGKNYFDMLMGPMFFFHFFNPVLAAINFIFFAPATKITTRAKLFVILPPIVYAIPYFICVVLLHLWTDFYNFTFGGQFWPIIPVFFIICAVTYLIATLLAYFHNKCTN